MYCARSSSWRQPRRPQPVRSSAEALEVVALAMSRPLRPETIAFVLDAEGCGTTVLVVDGTERAESVLDVTERIAEAAGLAGAASIVVASIRPTLPIDALAASADQPDDDGLEHWRWGGSLDDGLVHADIDRWLEASDIAAEHAIELLEWFVVGPAGVVCPRELLGEPSRWPQPT
jgi:hypothetical protein